MDAIERLKRDHTILRSKLEMLESALQMGSRAWYVLHEISFTLAQQLKDHLKREETHVTGCRSLLNPKVLAEVAVEHRDEPEHLRTINRLFVSQPPRAMELIQPALVRVIEGLRRHMAEEEAELFPLLERAYASLSRSTAAVTTSPSRLQETMTVNHVVQAFPSTKPVFERLFMNVSLEGCTCLDEVAWRHGMDCQQLLTLLEEALPSCAAQASVASTEKPHEQEVVAVGR